MTIVCDTNIYLQLTRTRDGRDMDTSDIKGFMCEIKSKEKKAGIVTGLAHVVWLELFARLANSREGRTDVNCLNALIAGLLHCQGEINDPVYQFLIGYEGLLVAAIFGSYDASDDLKHYDWFCSIVRELHDYPTQSTIDKHMPFLAEKMRYVQERERNFITTYETFLNQRFPSEVSELRSLNSKKEKMAFLNKLLASDELMNEFCLTLAAMAYQASDRTRDRDDLDACISIIKRLFPAPIFLILDMLQRRFDNDIINIANKVNWVWDYELLFQISPVEDRILVTRDGDMVKAADNAGLGNKVWTFERYKQEIGI
jgi:hypothetical protein